jgi:hypothetical protein
VGVTVHSISGCGGGRGDDGSGGGGGGGGGGGCGGGGGSRRFCAPPLLAVERGCSGCRARRPAVLWLFVNRLLVRGGSRQCRRRRGTRRKRCRQYCRCRRKSGSGCRLSCLPLSLAREPSRRLGERSRVERLRHWPRRWLCRWLCRWLRPSIRNNHHGRSGAALQGGGRLGHGFSVALLCRAGAGSASIRVAGPLVAPLLYGPVGRQSELAELLLLLLLLKNEGDGGARGKHALGPRRMPHAVSCEERGARAAARGRPGRCAQRTQAAVAPVAAKRARIEGRGRRRGGGGRRR